MEIVTSKLCGVPLLRVGGNVDHLAGSALLAATEEVLDPETAHILLDLEACPYLDSGGIGAILQIFNRVKWRVGWLGVIAPTQGVNRLLEIVGLTLDPDFRVFANKTEAESRLQAEALGF